MPSGAGATSARRAQPAPVGATTRFASPFPLAKTWASGSPSTESSSFASSSSRERPSPQIPNASAATAATAATAESRRTERRPELDDVRPLAAGLREDPLAQRGAGAGPPAPCASAPETAQKDCELLAAGLAGGEVRLVALPLPRVERVERVGGGQLEVVFHASLSAFSSRSSRRRESPENIRLLMVPIGWPSRAASSDWVNPP